MNLLKWIGLGKKSLSDEKIKELFLGLNYPQPELSEEENQVRMNDIFTLTFNRISNPSEECMKKMLKALLDNLKQFPASVSCQMIRQVCCRKKDDATFKILEIFAENKMELMELIEIINEVAQKNKPISYYLKFLEIVRDNYLFEKAVAAIKPFVEKNYHHSYISSEQEINRYRCDTTAEVILALYYDFTILVDYYPNTNKELLANATNILDQLYIDVSMKEIDKILAKHEWLLWEKEILRQDNYHTFNGIPEKVALTLVTYSGVSNDTRRIIGQMISCEKMLEFLKKHGVNSVSQQKQHLEDLFYPKRKIQKILKIEPI